ncbi:extracellular catalytic domain type 1 short-chain-length polyhydroxyalkanoate depolymerase [Niallia endozanthoxylica]|uniref:PHB depolymerase family esterase n=1 Tax=Niallia endozanthoxylica TaxID=2036016 RepID=A0A5J5HZV8_9BACI|nr:PHB depolymerase family esterase [Niallia endozanthoxylica]KAA9028438.1 PHB depolymerase family esterase [Niallia endozanthoxylica]
MGNFKDFLHEGFFYKLYIPSGPINESLPMVVMLHGCEQSPDQFAEETKMNQLAEKEHFIVLYPTMKRIYNPLFLDPHKSNPAGCWNWFLDENQHRGEGLPKSIVNLMRDAEKKLSNQSLSIDWTRIYSAGFSSGGAMATILGVTYPDLFSGIAVCSGLPYDAANTNLWKDPWNIAAELVMRNGVRDPYKCGSNAFLEMQKAYSETGIKRKVPLIVFHGTNDLTVHPKNASQIIIQWNQAHFLLEGGKGHVNAAPTSVKIDAINNNGRRYSQHSYTDTNDLPAIELYLVHDMEHMWSGGNSGGKFTDPLGPDASSIIWDFFKRAVVN